jgi:thiol:disulfide interchange protein DsbD
VTQAPAFAAVSSTAELDSKLAKPAPASRCCWTFMPTGVSCKEMESETFPDAAVSALMKRFVLVRADVTANLPAHQALLKRFGLYGPPGIILFDPSGQEKGRVIGFTRLPILPANCKTCCFNSNVINICHHHR